MTMPDTPAKSALWPSDSRILLRAAFLYVGQGASSLVLASDGKGSYRSLLLDINLDEGNGGIDIPRLMADLLGDTGLDVFMNSHPHDDHLSGVAKLAEAVDIGEVWHSGHKPGRKYEACYKELMAVVDSLKGRGQTEHILK